MPELERVNGMRVVAAAGAMDAARWTGDDLTILRVAPDEAFAIGATAVDIDDPHAIVEHEAGFAVGPVDLAEVAGHIEWSLPSERPCLAQGSIAGVPAKLWLTDDGATLIVHAAYADDLQARLR